MLLEETVEYSSLNPQNLKAARITKKSDLHGTAAAFIRKGNEGIHCENPHTCCFCQKVCSTRNHLKIHIASMHCRSTSMLCDHCGKTYYDRQTICRHMVRVHGEKKIVCKICDYKTALNYSFQRHKLTHKAGTKCPICKKQVTFLKSHMKCHQPRESCSFCFKLFRKESLKFHMRSHLKKDFKCRSCDEVFTRKEDLRM